MQKRSRALRTDSLLVLISSSGISSMSLSWCPGWLKCCQWYCVVSFVLHRSAVFTKSVSLVSFSLSDVFHRCVWGIFTFTTLDHVNEILRCTCDRLLYELSLASVSECTWWYFLNEGTGFASDGVAFLYGRCLWSRCLCLFPFTRRSRRFRGRLYAIKGRSEKASLHLFEPGLKIEAWAGVSWWSC